MTDFAIDDYLKSPDADKLTKCCLNSMMHLGGVFDYQGALFEATASLNSIAKVLERSELSKLVFGKVTDFFLGNLHLRM